jgi:retron-type reverse transcriptase
MANRFVVSKNQSGGGEYPDLLADLFTAYYCARKNKRNTASQIRFERNLSDNLMRLYDDIVSGHYRVGRSMCFVIRDPVLREVFAASFRDRIVHHLLYNLLMPIFEPTFIYDSYSCREGKGTLFGIKRLEHHIRSCSDNYRRESYVLKLDIEGYFMNISRQRLYDVIESRLIKHSSKHSVPFDLPLVLRLLSQVIFNEPTKGCYRKGSIHDWDELPRSKSLFYASAGCGLPIGNLTSQLFSNIYLSALDEYVKRGLRCKHYGRYVDDFYIVGNSSQELLALIPLIKEFLSSHLGLKLHPRKVHLVSVSKGVHFLGAVVKPYQRYIYPKCLSRLKNNLLCSYVEEADPYRILAKQKSYAGYLSHFMNNHQIG